MMTKIKVLFIGFVVLLFSININAQKPQHIAYVDMSYILNHIEGYQQANGQLDNKIKQWQAKLDLVKENIQKLKTDLAAEQVLLTPDLIQEKEEDIKAKEEEFTTLQTQYFGSEGDLFRLRQQLVKPIQDQVFNAIQEIGATRGYDFVLDKSSDLIMLYSNDRYDVSDLVVKSITKQDKLKSRKKISIVTPLSKSEKTEQEVELDSSKGKTEIKEQKVRNNRQEMLNRVARQKVEQEKKRKERLKQMEEDRQKRVKQREEALEKVKQDRDEKLRKANEQNKNKG